MNLYNADILIKATVYVKAESEEEAQEKVLKLNGLCLELSEDEHAELPITGMTYNNPDLPDISLSPAVTVGYADPIQVVEEDIDADPEDRTLPGDDNEPEDA
jgi:hypothetical protein